MLDLPYPLRVSDQYERMAKPMCFLLGVFFACSFVYGEVLFGLIALLIAWLAICDFEANLSIPRTTLRHKHFIRVHKARAMFFLLLNTGLWIYVFAEAQLRNGLRFSDYFTGGASILLGIGQFVYVHIIEKNIRPLA